MGIDYYAVLNIPRDCSLTEMRIAYRKYAIAAHPLRKPYPGMPTNPPEGSSDEILHLAALPPQSVWNLVNEAYDALSNPMHREVYDQYGEEGLKRGTYAPCGYIPPYLYHGDSMKTYRDAFGSESPYVDIVDTVIHPPALYFDSNGETFVRMKDPAIRTNLYLNLKEIFYGALKKIKIYRNEFVNEDRTKTEVRECILQVTIPPGTLPNTEITFPDQGDQGPSKYPADIIFTTVDMDHDVFYRKGADLHMTEDIDLATSLNGFAVTVVTIDDRLLRIPIVDVVHPDYVKCVVGEGLPYQNDNTTKGNLYIHFKIAFPKRLPREIRIKLKELLNNSKVEIREEDELFEEDGMYPYC